MQRTRRSFYNVMVTVATNICILATAFLVQKVFVGVKGAEYNGINGLFTSVISMMSLTDLGIGSAIIYHLYRPAEERDYDMINALLRFYRNSYIVISGVVLIIGLGVMAFLPQLTEGAALEDNIYLIFLLFLADCLCSYFLSYKKSLLYAYQMNYVLDGIHFGCYMAQNCLQLLVICVYKDYILFLIVKTISKYIENVVISVYIRRHYPYTKEKKVSHLKREVRKDITKKVKALLFHRMGALLITGSDSLVITGVLGLMDMSRYTNYNMILGGITALLNKIFETLTSSVGNFLLHSEPEQRRDVYQKIDFLNFWLFGCCAVGMYAVFDAVITLWVGEYFLFPKAGVLAITLNFYIQGMRQTVLAFKNAAGIYHEDRYVPLAEAAINVVVSVILAWKMGIAGVFAGTIISSGAALLYSYPRYVCGPLLDMGYGAYIGRMGKHLLIVAAAFYLTGRLVRPLPLSGSWAELFIGGGASVLIFHVLFLAVYGRSAELKYFRGLLKGIILRRG